MAQAFESMKLRPELICACRQQGFRTPTPVQALVIPVVMQGADIIVEAKTGSGKTLAYGLPLLNAELSQSRLPEALVLVPTRELAGQVSSALVRASGALPRRVVGLMGGGGMDQQEAQLRSGANIVVATLGRLEEMLERGLLSLNLVRTLVLDEVDELMHGGFSANLAALLKQMPERRQTLVFSASISHDVEKVVRQFTRDPQRLQLTAARDLPSEVSHRILRTRVKERVADLVAFLQIERPYQVLLFCGTRNEAEEVNAKLGDVGFEAEFLHGDLSAVKRRRLIERFRTGELPLLVATDVAARGLDLPGVDLVVNYSLPEGPTAYLHRAGRTGRAGKSGVVLTLLIEQQHSRFEHLKDAISFEKVEIRGKHTVVRRIKSREERDLEFRRLPRRGPPQTKDRGPASRAGRGGPKHGRRQSR